MLPAKTHLTELAIQINGEHDACEQALKTGVSHAIRAGELLLEAKKAVGHGGWLRWIAGHCMFSARTAQVYVRFATRGKELGLENLPLRDAMKQLAAPSNTQRVAHLRPLDDLPPGFAAVGEADGATAYVLPSDHEGYLYCAIIHPRENGGDIAATVDGLARPINRDFIWAALRVLGFPQDVAWETFELDPPFDFNPLMYESRAEYERLLPTIWRESAIRAERKVTSTP